MNKNVPVASIFATLIEDKIFLTIICNIILPFSCEYLKFVTILDTHVYGVKYIEIEVITY